MGVEVCIRDLLPMVRSEITATSSSELNVDQGSSPVSMSPGVYASAVEFTDIQRRMVWYY